MAASEQVDVPIFRLPDELLLEVISYITSIEQKMLLEQVSRKFNQVSADPSNWKGIDSLELVIKCDEHEWRPYDISVLQTNCDLNNVHLNGIAVPFKNWPKAIESFLHRTQLHHFTIHFGKEIYSLVSSTDIFPRLMEIFGQNQAKIMIQSIEIHCANSLDIHKIDGFGAFIPDLLKSAVPHLREIRCFADSADSQKGIGRLFWPIIQKCNKLKSICYRDRQAAGVYFGALMGKPLNKMAFYIDSVFHFTVHARRYVKVINGVSGDGLQSLSIEGYTIGGFIKYFHSSGRLTENSRKKLKFLSLSDYSPVDYITKYVPLIPIIFPNIERCDIEYGNAFSDRVNQFSTVVNGFFNLTHDGPITRHFTIRNLRVYFIKSKFKAELTQFCHNNQIEIDFGEMQPTPYAYLSKGKSSFIIQISPLMLAFRYTVAIFNSKK